MHCVYPGFCLSIDEQMKLFKGRSAQSVQMKNKPIKEGFKFFAICDAVTGFVYAFIPSGRLEGDKIVDIVLTLAKQIPLRGADGGKKYVIGMDNCFTLPDSVNGLRQLNIACVGTARGRRGWPPKEIKDINDDRFNTLYHLNDRKDFKICRWIDNNVVTMVSTLHDGSEKIQRQRRHPRITIHNRNHVSTVWGNTPIREIETPGVIDDYTHWMLDVDTSDQFISYYRPKLRVRRYWMAMMFHGLDIIRSNSFIVFKELTNPKYCHKQYVSEFIEGLLGQANEKRFGRTRMARARSNTPSPTAKVKRIRMRKSNPALPDDRFRGSPEQHVMTQAPGNKQR